MATGFNRPSLSWALRFALLCGAYYLGGRIGLSMPFVGSHVSLIWPPTGIALAALLRWSPALWPAVWLAAFGVNLSVGSSVLLALGIACGNTLGPWAAATLLRRRDFQPHLPRQQDLLWYIGVAVVGGMAINASNGALQLWLAGLLPTEGLAAAWLTWWLGDAMGALVVGMPLLTLNLRGLREARLNTRRGELALALALTLGTGAWVFLGPRSNSPAEPVLFLPFLLLCWLAIRGGAGLGSTAALALSAFAVWATANGGGPFQTGELHRSLTLLWGYMATATIIAVTAAVLVSKLRESEQRLALATAGAHLGLWDWDLPSGRVSLSGPWESAIGWHPRQIGAVSQWEGLVHPDDQPARAQALAEHLQGRAEVYEAEFRMRTPADTWTWVQSRGQVVERDGQGNPLRMAGTLQDITRRKDAEQGLRQAEARFRSVVENVKEVVFQTDAAGRWRYLNPAWEEVTGFPVETSLGRVFLDYVHPEDRERNLALFKPLIAREKDYCRHEIRYLHASDGFRWIEVFARLTLDAEGGILGTSGTLTDVTERHNAAEQLRLAASVFRHSREGIVITDEQARIIDVNEAFCRITGYPREEVLGRTPAVLRSGRQGDEFYRRMWETLLVEGAWQGEVWNRRKDGEIYPELLAISAVRDADDRTTHFIGLFTDITLIKTHERALERIAHYDALTQLPNRVLLADRMRMAIAQAERGHGMLAVAYLDLDGFKAINDQRGHAAGDALLVEIARRLKHAVRAADTVARLGGDEFVLLLNASGGVEECEAVLRRVLAMVSEPVPWGSESLVVSASIGVALYPTDDADADTLLRHADQAMYVAKEAGRNRYHLFDPDVDRRLRSRRAHVERLRMALAQGELVLHYQPKVNMRLGKVVGVEALIRWQHPDEGLVYPDRFLPHLNDPELEAAIGEWVIDGALTQTTAWQRQGLSLPVSVNIASAHLERSDFAARLRERMDRHPKTSAALELEVLESAAVEDLDRVADVIQACAGLGVSFALDDFGTGYSSLTYLKRLPAATLKIDKSFVKDMLEDADDLAIVEGVIGLTGAFRRQVIAEGVETVEHGLVLLQMGCELAQGYGIARPMPGDRIPAWVRSWQGEPAWASASLVRWNRDNLPLLAAVTAHRRWVDQLIAVLSGNDPPPELDPARCAFGRWQLAQDPRRHSTLPSYPRVLTLHRQVHGLGHELIGLRDTGRAPEALQRAGEMLALRDQLVSGMHELMREGGQGE